MSVYSNLKEVDLEEYFPKSRGWKIVEKPLYEFDFKPTVLGTPIRCIDKDFGVTRSGYDPETVPLAPAWPGAGDGMIPFYRGSLDEKMETAAQRTKAIGFEIANHGDYIQGDNGCAFRKALTSGEFEGLPNITREQYQVLTTKFGVHYTVLHRPEVKQDPEGIVLNDNEYTTVLPGGVLYTTDTWFGNLAGLDYDLTLPVIERTGELLLPEYNRILFIATSYPKN